MAISTAELVSETADRVCPACGAKNLRTSTACYACGHEISSHGVYYPPPTGGPLVGDDQITIRVAWRIGVNSWRLVGRNPSLLVFPLVGGGASLAALAVLGLGFYSLHPNVSTLPIWTVYHLLWAILFLVAAYVVVVVLSTIAMAGLIGASALALQGARPTARDGWRLARAHLRVLIVWALLDATVGLVLSVLARRAGITGGILGLVGGIAWGLGTYFVVQVLMLETPRLRWSIGRSAQLMRHLFGDLVFSDILADLFAAAGLVLVLGTFGVSIEQTAIHGFSVGYLLLSAGGLVAGTYLMILGSTVSAVVQTGLFRYAVTGTLDPTLFSNVQRGGPHLMGTRPSA